MARRSEPIAKVEAEYAGADFHDARLSKRLLAVANRMASEPEASFPNATQNDAELEATYRFLNNADVAPERILAPHQRETRRRAAQSEAVWVAHDTTEFNFGKGSRDDLGRVGRGQSFGFYGHLALAVSADERRAPLGVVGFAVHTRRGGKGRPGHRARQADPTNEFQRWGNVVDQAEQCLSGLRPIHVMDREADSYAFLVELASTNKRFVIRMASSKRQLADDAGTVADILTAATVVAEREVPLSTRGRSSLPSYRKLHPARQERIARLEIVSAAVTIKRPCSSNTSASKTLALNVVQVREPAPPEGEVPVEWRLWTTEPVATREQALAVVDAYRGRWRIEEYFKALKQGCAIEKRQLESHDGLVNTLALMVPIAWRLLCLRTFAHAAAALPATAVLSPRQVHCLRAALIKRKRPPLPKSPTVRDALFGIAGLGGHIKNNGDPGWMVLGRGFDDLLMIELGYMLAVEDGEM